jgi:hypothetical protein
MGVLRQKLIYTLFLFELFVIFVHLFRICPSLFMFVCCAVSQQVNEEEWYYYYYYYYYYYW